MRAPAPASPGSTSSLRVNLLGGFDVRVGDRPVPDAWRLRRAKSVVKLLALAEGHRMHRDLVAETLWPDHDRAAAANNLHQALHAARRALGSAGGGPELLRLHDDVLTLGHPGAVRTDVQDFEAAARTALAAGRAEDCQAVLDAFPAELLPEDRFEDWADEHRRRLDGLRAAVEAALAEALVDAGRADEAVRLLQSSSAGHATDEARQRTLIRALDATGRHWDAIDAYESLRSTLEERYGSSPEPETVDLLRRILAGQAALPHRAATNLPVSATTFVGRRRELAELHGLVDRTRLLTLSGPGGVGKTRLAVQLARQLTASPAFPDGVWFAALSGLRDGSHVTATVAAVLGLTSIHATIRPAAVADLVADRRLALVLDNCEHVLEAAAALVEAMLARSPGLLVVTTSREPLHLPGEVVWRVPSLGVPELGRASDPAATARHESVQLFVRRATEVAPHFHLDGSTSAAVARICRRLDGIPLALEFAAARVAHLAPAQIAALLDDALTTVAGRVRSTPDRQLTLRATLDWSHDLLDRDEQVLLRRLSVFAGGFGLDAAEQVCAGGLGKGVREALAGLVDKSLVVAGTSTAPEARYRLLEVVRVYAAGRLADAGEAAELRRRHALWYVRRAAALDTERSGPVAGEPDAWLGLELENLRVALETALDEDPDGALEAILAAWRLLLARGMHAEGRRWLSRALDASSTRGELRARALFAAAVFEIRLGRSALAADIGAEIAAIGAALDDPDRAAEACQQQVLLTWLAGDWAQTDRLVATTAPRVARSPGACAAHHHLCALLALSRGDIEAARSAALQSATALDGVPDDAPPFFPVCSLAFSVGRARNLHFPVFEETMLAGRRVGVAQARGYVWSTLALAERMDGRFAAATAALDRAGRAFRALDDPAGQAHVLVQRGHLLRERGDPASSRTCFASAIDLRAGIQDQRGTAVALAGLAVCEALLGRRSRAQSLADEATQVLEGSGDLPGRSGALDDLAAVEVVCGRLNRAADAVERALSLAAVPSAHRSVGWQHTLLAGLRLRLGDVDGAAAELGAATAVFDEIGERRGLAVVGRLGDRIARAKPPLRAHGAGSR
ncbi:MAG: BTAD domain-containing putative transcriptional regulator [Cellulomonas sp.]